MRKTIIATTLATVAVLGGTATAASAEGLAAGQVVAQTETTTEEQEGGDGDKSGLLGLLGLAGLAGLLRRRENADAHKH